MKRSDLIAEPWEDYELIDSGDGEKLERYGSVTLIRPETQALWSPARPAEWKKAAARFRFKDGKGSWEKKNGTPAEWGMKWREIRFTVRLTSFKHTGVFPEQVPNWEWLAERAKRLEQPKVLNLFGYTGIASVVAARSGARVTQIDASKQTNAWAKDNARISGAPEGSIRFLLDDALKFAEREGRRGSVYDGIILDPPAFGRGPKGEVWKIEEGFAPLFKALVPLFSSKPDAFFILNGYAAGYSPRSFLQAMESALPETSKAEGEFGELNIKESGSGRFVPSGIYLRFVR
jgi:23S rRNA (cytosine1962-C5)-methyltransferase